MLCRKICSLCHKCNYTIKRTRIATPVLLKFVAARRHMVSQSLNGRILSVPRAASLSPQELSPRSFFTEPVDFRLRPPASRTAEGCLQRIGPQLFGLCNFNLRYRRVQARGEIPLRAVHFPQQPCPMKHAQGLLQHNACIRAAAALAPSAQQGGDHPDGGRTAQYPSGIRQPVRHFLRVFGMRAG